MSLSETGWQRTAFAVVLVVAGAAYGALMGAVTEAMSYSRTGMIIAGALRGLGAAAALGILLGTVAMVRELSTSPNVIPEHRLSWQDGVTAGLAILASSFLLGSAIMCWWVSWGGAPRGKPGVMYALKGCLYTGLVLGVPIGLYGILYLVAHAQLRAYRAKMLAVVIPVVVLSHVIPGSSHVGPWLLSLQVLAILIPGLAARRPLTTCLVGAVGGFVFCALYRPVWSYVRFVVGFYGLRIPWYKDDSIVIFPSVIVLVVLDICVAKFMLRRYSQKALGSGSPRPKRPEE